MAKHWIVKDPNEILGPTKKLVRIHAATHDLSSAEAVSALVAAGSTALQHHIDYITKLGIYYCSCGYMTDEEAKADAHAKENAIHGA